MDAHLAQLELAEHWRVSPRTLERRRWLKKGPAFLKVGTAVRYRMQDVHAFEATQLCPDQTEPRPR